MVDAATDVGTGTTKANTAILHTGFDAVPGSLESRLLGPGQRAAARLRNAASIPVERTGALLVAWTDEQRPRAARRSRKKRGRTEKRDPPGLRHRASTSGGTPSGAGGAGPGWRIPDESVVTPWTTPLAYATEAVRASTGLELGRLVTGVRSEAGGHALAHHPRERPLPLARQRRRAGAVTSSTRMLGGRRLHDPPAPRRADRLRQAGAAAASGSILLPVPTAGDQGGAGGPYRVRQRAAWSHRRGHRVTVPTPPPPPGRPGRPARGRKPDRPGTGR